MKRKKGNKVVVLCILTIFLSATVFAWETFLSPSDLTVLRSDYGDGKRTEEYEVTVGGKTENIFLEVNEREYTGKEIQKLFQEVEKELDRVILGENESFDRVEQDLQLVTQLSGYPVEIQWELSRYNILNIDGDIVAEELDEKGTQVELRGTVFYKDEKMVYVRNVMVYPKTRTGFDKLFYDIEQELKHVEKKTRKNASFQLPQVVGGHKIKWEKEKETHWQYVLFAGIGMVAFSIYKEKEKKKEKERKRNQELLREYPSVISKFTMLLSTGTTARNAWEKIVQNYDEQKETLGESLAYEEMRITSHEMQSGISEGEAYERFGKRCGVTPYLKFGTMLSQNLRKGSKGISSILRMEAIQSFENRKSAARRMAEETSTRLLLPMVGMLVVVLVMIMVPAFLTMQL